MQGVKRKLVYVTAYEIIGMAISALGLALLSGHAPSSTGPLAVVITTIAVSWNFIYNYVFEWWESRQASRARTLKRRILHAVGFQLTLVVYLIPLIAWWMGMAGAAAGYGVDRHHSLLYLRVQLGIRQAVRPARIGPAGRRIGLRLVTRPPTRC